ncbi:MAG: deoxyribonuclease IV [bacterium]
MARLDHTGHRNDDRGSGADQLPLIGAQIRTAGGFALVPERAVAIGAEAVQIFNSNPRTWRTRLPSPGEMTALTTGLGQHRLPLFLHTIYLINLASPDERLRQRSSQALAGALVLGALAAADGVVTHIGSHRGEGFPAATGWVIGAVRAAMHLAREELEAGGHERTLPPLLLETGAGSGGTVGGSLEELAELLASLQQHCGLCLDTAHLFAAGYAVHTGSGLERLVEEVGERGLLPSVGLIHLNDSKAPFASARDRHENPGEGFIGFAGLARVVKHPAFAAIPFVLEVPGSDGHGPDAATVALVKLMREGAADPREPPVPAA